MEKDIRLSFILPAWKARFLRDAIGSIVAQSCPDWELVVVDDCSPEPLREIVESFADARIRYTRNETNLGGGDLVRQWNHSLSFAAGDYVVLAADDDIYRPTFCEEVLRLADKYPQVDLIHSSVEQIGENGEHLWDDSILPEFTSKYEYLHWWLTGLVHLHRELRLQALRPFGDRRIHGFPLCIRVRHRHANLPLAERGRQHAGDAVLLPAVLAAPFR